MTDTKSSEAKTLDIHAILEQLPHRYPFLLIDRVTSVVAGESVTAIKNVTINEPYFTGHFPQRPVMPGVLIIEALAQATGILAFITAGQKPDDNMLYYFAGIDNARFKKPVEPGDQIILQATLVKQKRNIWKFKGTATVDGEIVATADLMCASNTY